ncbi:hypothetical protein RFI_11838 [Reticulomyxa filosa]|uniref:Prefoldin subunit 5 n=1 Tax=Reticulomyxa filosa TaxID=46433 RepID=X6NHC8_RETFI|nr:hypothetical protein RFI_11838 [Reticulomyxa filosa]|eukprot:ETO25303.1 hypothetical protein RFI_11838 [Reticulomyxa filosa]
MCLYNMKDLICDFKTSSKITRKFLYSEMAKAETKSNKQAIPIEQLPPVQLLQLKEQQQQFHEQNYQTLVMAKNRYQASKDVLDRMKADNSNKQTLIPLTDSLYIPAKLTTSKVLVDLGVGYFAERTPKQAQGYFERKIVVWCTAFFLFILYDVCVLNGCSQLVGEKIEQVRKAIDQDENSIAQIDGVLLQRQKELMANYYSSLKICHSANFCLGDSSSLTLFVKPVLTYSFNPTDLKHS